MKPKTWQILFLAYQVLVVVLQDQSIPEFLDSGRWTLDSGRSALDSGRWTLNAGLWTLNPGLWTLDARRWMLHFGH